MDSALLVVGER
jgi:hypothetical protein